MNTFGADTDDDLTDHGEVNLEEKRLAGIGSEIHLDSDEWGEILYTLKQARYISENSHRTFLNGIISKLEAAGIQSND